MKVCISPNNESILSTGYSKDGGLYVPESLPTITKDEIKSWAGFTYPQVVAEVMAKFVADEELPKDELKAILDRAYRRFDPKINGEVVRVSVMRCLPPRHH